MTHATRLELGLMAGFGLTTLILAGLWRNGATGGFVVLVSFGATIAWALWLGWRPALEQLPAWTGLADEPEPDLTAEPEPVDAAA